MNVMLVTFDSSTTNHYVLIVSRLVVGKVLAKRNDSQSHVNQLNIEMQILGSWILIEFVCL